MWSVVVIQVPEGGGFLESRHWYGGDAATHPGFIGAESRNGRISSSNICFGHHGVQSSLPPTPPVPDPFERSIIDGIAGVAHRVVCLF